MQQSKQSKSYGGRWTPGRKVMVGISAVALMEVFERLVGLRSRSARAVARWWVQLDDANRRDVRRAEAHLLARVLAGQTRPRSSGRARTAFRSPTSRLS
jgi:hypothetical protein